MGQSGGASRWRVCYQRGLPRLVFNSVNILYVGRRQKGLVQCNICSPILRQTNGQSCVWCKLSCFYNAAVSGVYMCFCGHTLLIQLLNKFFLLWKKKDNFSDSQRTVLHTQEEFLVRILTKKNSQTHKEGHKTIILLHKANRVQLNFTGTGLSTKGNINIILQWGVFLSV